MLVGVKAAFEMLAQSLGVKVGSLGGVDFTPVSESFLGSFKRAPQPVDIYSGKSLGGEVVTAVAVRTLAAAVAPDKGGILFAILWEAILSGDTRVRALEGADFERDQA